jgi:hypothetical protein
MDLRQKTIVWPANNPHEPGDNGFRIFTFTNGHGKHNCVNLEDQDSFRDGNERSADLVGWDNAVSTSAAFNIVYKAIQLTIDRDGEANFPVDTQQELCDFKDKLVQFSSVVVKSEENWVNTKPSDQPGYINLEKQQIIDDDKQPVAYFTNESWQEHITKGQLGIIKKHTDGFETSFSYYNENDSCWYDECSLKEPFIEKKKDLYPEAIEWAKTLSRRELRRFIHEITGEE